MYALDQILQAVTIECANKGNYIYIYIIVQRHGAPGTKRKISLTCCVYVLHMLFALGFRVKLEIRTSKDDSHGSEDDCRSKTKADQ